MPDEAQRIVVFLPNWVGDAVMFTPALRAIRERFADAHLAILARPAPAAVLTPNPWTDEIIVADGIAGEFRALRRKRFDLAVLGTNSFRSALIARLGGVSRRIGYNRDSRGWLLTDKIPPLRDTDGKFTVVPALDYYLKLAQYLGCDTGDKRMELTVADADAGKAETLLNEADANQEKPIVLLNPGASYGPAKMYPLDRFADVADGLIESSEAQIIINAGPAEKTIAEAVEDAMKHPPMLNLARVENSLGLLKAMVRISDLMITNDTGPRHFAAAFGVPVVTVFGPTDPDWAKIYYDNERIVRMDIPCGPCQKKACPLPTGPEQHQCMLKITPEMVLCAAEELLREIGDANLFSCVARAVRIEQGGDARLETKASYGEENRLASPISLLKREGLDTLDGAFAYTSAEELSKPGLGTRRRFRLSLTDESGKTVEWYLKRYGLTPWLRRLWRTSPARREFRNIRRLQAGGVPTMNAVTMGEERDALSPRRSYIIVTAVPGEALERCFDDFLTRHDLSGVVMKRFNDALVNLVAAIHSCGCVHRDLYASHIFLDETPAGLKLYLIDLARVFAPKLRRFRWRVKDLAQLKYSMPSAWVNRHWDDFLRRYLSDTGDARIWSEAINRKVASMRRRQHNRAAETQRAQR